MPFYQVKKWKPQGWGLVRYGEKQGQGEEGLWSQAGQLERWVGCPSRVNRSRFRGHWGRFSILGRIVPKRLESPTKARLELPFWLIEREPYVEKINGMRRPKLKKKFCGPMHVCGLYLPQSASINQDCFHFCFKNSTIWINLRVPSKIRILMWRRESRRNVAGHCSSSSPWPWLPLGLS